MFENKAIIVSIILIIILLLTLVFAVKKCRTKQSSTSSSPSHAANVFGPLRALSGTEKNVIMTDASGNLSTDGIGKISDLKVGSNIELNNNGSFVVNTTNGNTVLNDVNSTNVNGTIGVNRLKGDTYVDNGLFVHKKFYTEPSTKGNDPLNQRFVIRHRRGNAWTVFDQDDDTNLIAGTTNINGNLGVNGNSLVLGNWEFRTCESPTSPVAPGRTAVGVPFLQMLYKGVPVFKFSANSEFAADTNVESTGRADWTAWRLAKCP